LALMRMRCFCLGSVDRAERLRRFPHFHRRRRRTIGRDKVGQRRAGSGA
jgi:hypothetical protein